MSFVQLKATHNTLNGTICLPASKSISNRAFIIQALCEHNSILKNLSLSEDTRILKNGLQSNRGTIDVGAAGTAARFLTAYFSTRQGEYHLTGNHRMKERPIGVLVDALNKLGADIRYVESEGFLPLQIMGRDFSGGTVQIPGNISSQFISALMMIAPTLTGGLTIECTSEVHSKPYISMTASVMNPFGVDVHVEEKTIYIPERAYLPTTYVVEPDWSSASYYYALLALCEKGEIFFPGLSIHSIQGDSVIADWFEDFGIQTIQKGEGVLIRKVEADCINRFEKDFSNYPDMAQTFMVLCAAKSIPAVFSGLTSLRIKETDRVLAMQQELEKIGAQLTVIEEGVCQLVPGRKKLTQDFYIETYQDHRMAMAFAPFCMKNNHLLIQHPDVVQKSNPDFWKHINQLGVDIAYRDTLNGEI